MQYEEDYFILACTVRIGADKFGMLKKAERCPNGYVQNKER